MTLTFTIEHADETTTELPGSSIEINWRFGRLDLASCYIDRPTAVENDFTVDEDEVYVEYNGETHFGGILEDVRSLDGEVELLVESFEKLAADAKPTPGDEAWDGASDETIVKDAIDSVDSLDVQTVEELMSSMTMIFSHTSPAKKIREVAEATGGELRYHADKTVSYVDTLGDDKTSTTLSPANRNVTEYFTVETDGDDRVTHLRLLGAGEGEAQISTEVIADGWQTGDHEIWDTLANKDYTDADVLAEHGAQIIAERSEIEREVQTVVVGEEVNLGDEFHLQHPQEDVDWTLRAVEVDEIIDTDGHRYDCTFSNRRLTRESGGEKDVRDVSRYNRAFEGSPVTINASAGRQPVDSDHVYQMHVYYPGEVQYEHRVQLQVVGLAYRHFSEPVAHSHGFTVSSHNHSVTYSVPGHKHNTSTTALDTSEEEAGGDWHDHTYYQAVETVGTTDEDEDTVTSSSGGYTSSTTDDVSGVDPGIVEISEYPENCTVSIDGTEVANSIGSGGQFEETIDLAGELTPGQWNTIEISSETLGHIMATLDIDVYRQILGRG